MARVACLATAAIAGAGAPRDACAFGWIARARSAFADQAAACVAAVRIHFTCGARIDAGAATRDDSAWSALLPDRALVRRRASCSDSAIGDRSAFTRRFVERVSDLTLRRSLRAASAIAAARTSEPARRATRDGEESDKPRKGTPHALRQSTRRATRNSRCFCENPNRHRRAARSRPGTSRGNVEAV